MAEKEKNYFEDINIPLVVTIGIVSVVLVYLSIAGMSAWFYRYEQAEIERKVFRDRFESLVNLQVEQLERLNSYRWVDKEKGIIAIPIDRAMELTVRELSEKRGDTGKAESSLRGTEPQPTFPERAGDKVNQEGEG